MMVHKAAREVFKFLAALVFIFVTFVILAMLTFSSSWVIEGAVYLLTGWVLYPFGIASKVKVDWTAIITAAVALLLFTIGLHVFLKWLMNSRSQEGNQGSWRLRSSLNATLLIVFLFVAGLSTVGLVHQITWMATTDEELIQSDFPTFEQIGPIRSTTE